MLRAACCRAALELHLRVVGSSRNNPNATLIRSDPTPFFLHYSPWALQVPCFYKHALEYSICTLQYNSLQYNSLPSRSSKLTMTKDIYSSDQYGGQWVIGSLRTKSPYILEISPMTGINISPKPTSIIAKHQAPVHIRVVVHKAST